MYSVTTVLHPHIDKKGRQKIQIRVIYKRSRVYLKTDFKVLAGAVNPKINAIVQKQMKDAENRLLDAIDKGLTPQAFKTLFKQEQKVSLVSYFEKMLHDLRDRLAPGTQRQYRVVMSKIDPEVSFDDITVKWLQDFERGLSGLDGNTINSNMKRLRAVLNRAAADGYISTEKFRGYKVPPYRQKLVDYLTEKEINAFTKITKMTSHQSKKLSGYYFLLAYYTGWRISDTKIFNNTKINGDRVVIRATKNGRIVSMPIISRLREILDFVTRHPFNLSEERARIFIKQIAKDAGIKKRVGFQTARHSFAMLLMANGFTIDEVAELLGDSPLIAKVYARIHNESLDKKIRERLG